MSEDPRSNRASLRDPSVWTVAIAGGLIVWLICTIFLQPVLDAVSKFALFELRVLTQGQIDEAFHQATLDPRAPVLFGLSIIINSIMVGGFFAFYFYCLARLLRMTKPIKNSANEDVRKTLIREGYFVVIAGFVSSAVLAGFIMVQHAKYLITIDAAATYDRRIRILAPYISERERMLFDSQWEQIATEKDYRILIRKMNMVPKPIEVKLPAPLI